MTEQIRELIARVNSTLGYFVKDYSSVQRTPYSEKERCSSFEEYVEARFNYEATRIPELHNAVVATGGKLFKCLSLRDANISKRHFEEAIIVLEDVNLLVLEDQNLIDEVMQVADLIGGSCISFNSVKVKIKYQIT